MKVRPLFAATGALVVGSAVGAQLPAAVPLLSVAAALAALCALLAPTGGTRLFLVLVALFATGWARRQAVDPIPHPVWGRRATLLGQVASPPEQSERTCRFTLDAGADGRVQVFARDASVRWGETVRIVADIEAPPEPTNPGQFDYAAYLHRRGIAAIARTRYGDQVAVISAQRPVAIAVADALRRRIAETTRRRLRTEDGALARGILLSLTGDLSDWDREEFAMTGTVHVLSTSGMHLAVVAGALHLALRRLRKVMRALVVLAALWLLVLASGASAAAVRSALMASIALAAPLLEREAEPLHTASAAAFVLVLSDPRALEDVGAQLSFATVVGLLMLVPILDRWLDRPEAADSLAASAGRKATLALGTGVAAQLASGPLTAYHFHLLSLAAPLVNVPVALLSEGVLLLGLAAAALDGVPGVGDALWLVTGILAHATRLVVGVAADHPEVALSIPEHAALVPVALLLALGFAARWGGCRATQSRLFRP